MSLTQGHIILYISLVNKHETKVNEYNELLKTIGESKAQLHEAQQRVADMEETVSDIQGVNVVIKETLKVQEKMIENLREDLGTQEDMEVVEISIENDGGNSCKNMII